MPVGEGSPGANCRVGASSRGAGACDNPRRGGARLRHAAVTRRMLGFLTHRSEHPRLARIRQLQSVLHAAPARAAGDRRSAARARRTSKAKSIFDEGEEGQALYVVLEGRVLICRQGDANIVRLAEIPPGALFGELALLDGVPRSAQARALENCVLGGALARRLQRPPRDARGHRLQDRVAARARPRAETRRAQPHRHDAAAVNDDYFAGGPVVWLLTIAITTLLLVAATQALWLVVPLLIAIILYYTLFPVVRRLSLSGMSREAAAALVAGCVTVAVTLVMIPLLPWLAAQSVAGQETLFRYLEGGRALIDRLLGALESQFAFLKRLDFQAEMGRRLGEYGDTALQKRDRRDAARRGSVAAVAAARAIFRVLLPARRPALHEARDARRAQRVLRAHDLHVRPRRHDRAQLLPGPAQADARSTPSCSGSAS